MGLLEKEALDQDLEYLAAAYAGYAEIMEQLFGSGKSDTIPKVPKGADGKPLVMTPAAFDVVFGAGNSKARRRKLN